MPEHTLPSPKELLDRLYILDAEERRRILDVIDRVTDPAGLEHITQLLTNALARQDEWTVKIAKSDLNFPKKLEKFLHERVTALKGETESADAQKLNAIASAFDA